MRIILIIIYVIRYRIAGFTGISRLFEIIGYIEFSGIAEISGIIRIIRIIEFIDFSKPLGCLIILDILVKEWEA